MAEHQVGPAGTFLRDGEMRQIDLDGTAVVIARVGAEYHAFGAKCTHYGAPLSKGVLKEHNLICPWHHAYFDIRNGARLEPPALNDLPHYPLRIEKGQIVVTLPKDNQTEPQGKADPSDQRNMVIIGGGSAGNAAAEELRRADFRGRIIVISQVPEIPIDRPNLSKDYMAGKADPSWIPLRSEGWYADRDIDLRLKTRAVKIDPRAHTIYLDPAGVVGYDKLLLATGGIPRLLSGVPGAEFDEVFSLRTLADADRIIAAADSGKKGKHAVIIGSSFIGMEVAASLAGGRGVQVTVIGRESVPFERTLGPEIGLMLQREHEANGVRFRLKSDVARIVGKQGHVSGVELKGGEKLPADFVIVGIGVRPATGFLTSSGLKLDEKDQSIRVNARLQSSDPDIYAAGDIARWDDGTDAGQRIEHWRTAEQQGIAAAQNMLAQAGNAVDINRHIPFFWTEQWGITLRCVGHAEEWDEIIYREGTPSQRSFVALYVADGQLKAAAGCQHDQELDAVEFILREKMRLTVKQMRDESFDLVTYARGAYSYS